MRHAPVKSVGIIGGGLAGAACAYELAQAGIESVIYEARAAVGDGASGNVLGLYNPRLAAEFGPESQYYAAAFEHALRVFPTLPDIDWNPCGALHLITDDVRAQRFAKMQRSWQGLRMAHLSAVEATARAGIDLRYEALFLSDSGSVSPRRLAYALARSAQQIVQQDIDDLDALAAHDAVIVACGMGSNRFLPQALPLRPVRGQVTIADSPHAHDLKIALCYGGYVIPCAKQGILIGATFKRGQDHETVEDAENTENIAKLAAIVPLLTNNLQISSARGGVRATLPDHFPAVGCIDANRRVYVSAGHGSHGILSGLMAAKLIVDMLQQKEDQGSQALLKKLSPFRF
ncbi:MAG: FAD-dependent 5-carboxymethylaminomethyl-2-thiouridine(34) oxidoreductase MnmC [Alphaproteobacteria bacterium]|nr:FAD-dependent 5-carboxymethylaminomethyl-2-thiouridine(34) oxidoreductase MnmC [Alphaproteobacteria bacterium]